MHASRPGAVVGVLVALATAAATLLVLTPAADGAGKKTVSHVKATWPAATATLGQTATVRGTITSKRLEARKISVYVSLKSGWRLASSTRSTAKGTFSVTLPTSYYYSRPVQLRSPATGRARAVVTKARTFTVTPGYTPAPSRYSWKPAVAGQETRVNPCAPVTYRINPGVPTSGAASSALVIAAFKRLGEATGITFRNLGYTTAFPRPRGAGPTPWPTDATIVVAWVKPDATQTFYELGGDPRFAIYSQSGILATRTAHDAQGPVKRITRAGVVLDAAPDPTSGALELRSWSLMHELAASLGLGAVTDGNQKMSEIIPNAAVDTNWGAGDLSGLNRVGLVEGCVTDGRR